MLDQNTSILLVSALFIAVPILVAIPIALFGSQHGSGRAVWVVALVALALTALGLRLATAIYGPGYDDIGPLSLGWFLSALGLALGLAICTVALIRSTRERRWAWVVALLVAALPLLAALPIFDLDVSAFAVAHPGEPLFGQLLDLAVLLPPIGCAVLVAYGVWTARRRWPTLA